MSNRMSVIEAAKIMDASPQFLREGLKQGLFGWGVAVRMPGGRYSYYINRDQFYKDFPQ